MLSFLNSVFLPALAAIFLPILIHLLTRRRLVERKWPSLRFIEEIQKRRMRKFKLKQLILLALRVLILILVIGAFARPAIKTAKSVNIGAHERTSVALLIDNSYSMGQETAGVDLFTKASQSAEDIFEILDEGDELSIIPFNSSPYPASREPFKALSGARQAIDSLKLSGSTTDIWNAISAAVAMLMESKLPNKEIFILTDDKDHGWLRSGELDLPKDIKLYCLVFSPDDERNIGLTNIEFPRTLLQKKVPFSLIAEIKSFASGAVTDFVVDLYLDGKRIAQRSVDLNPEEFGMLEFSAEFESGGFHYGEFRSEGDAIPTDNSRYFSFKIPKKINVLVVGGEEKKFISNALSPSNDDFFFVKRLSYNQLGSELLSSWDVVILSDPPELANNIGVSITGFLSRGGGLALFLGGSPDPGKSWKSIFGDKTTISVLASIGDSIGGGRFNLGTADFDHPVFTPFKEEGIPDVDFKRVAAITNSNKVPISLSNGVPLIAEMEFGEGKLAVCAFSANLRYGDLATSGFFVPLMHRLTQYLAEDVSEFDAGYIVGEEVVRVIEEPPSGVLTLTRPDSSIIFLSPRFASGNVIINVGRVFIPGIYKISSGDSLLDIFAINVDTRESEASKLDKKAVESAVKLKWLSPNKDIEKEILAQRFGRELHHGMLILAFILMIAELILGGTWRRPRDLSDQIKKKEGNIS
ncbi:BatA domain-containing protein [bacterium]|nr:BatA domain-containing protein [bacterium]